MPITTANSRHVALLRGINVGGKNRLPMKDLAGLFEAAGCTDITTYIQSGNVVFSARPALARRVPTQITRSIADQFGLQVPLVLRDAAQLAQVAAHNPFLRVGADPSKLHVAFLASTPTRDTMARLDPDRSPPDEFAPGEREIYLHLPNGAARSKLTNSYLDATLGTTSTVRNWRTVLKLVELTG